MARLVLVAACLMVAACSGEKSATVTLPKDFAFKSASVKLPDGFAATFPAGPGSAAMDNNCRTCHSPEMVLVQPPLKPEEWDKVIDKMRTVYKAPIPDTELPPIRSYLENYSARLSASLAAETAKARN